MDKDLRAGRLIRAARLKAGMSQAALAEAAGVVQSLVSRYESGAVQPTFPALERLIEATGSHLAIAVDPAPGQMKGMRPVPTHRFLTAEEGDSLDATYSAWLDKQPGGPEAKERWGKSWRSARLTGKPAYPKQRD